MSAEMEIPTLQLEFEYTITKADVNEVIGVHALNRYPPVPTIVIPVTHLTYLWRMGLIAC